MRRKPPQAEEEAQGAEAPGRAGAAVGGAGGVVERSGGLAPGPEEPPSQAGGHPNFTQETQETQRVTGDAQRSLQGQVRRGVYERFL